MGYFLVRTGESGWESTFVAVVKDPEVAKKLFHPIRWRILKELSKNPSYPLALAKKLKIDEQVVYYHIRILERLGVLEVERTEDKRGTLAKVYSVNTEAVACIIVDEAFEAKASPAVKVLSEREAKFLEPFVSPEGIKCSIVVGSPDAHGEFRARARDGHFAADLALFLGSTLSVTREIVTKLDTELSEAELGQNLIVVGGPRVNSVAAKLNDYLPIRFSLKRNSAIYSTISDTSYFEDEHGLIVKAPNPFGEGTYVLVLAGNSYPGTRAAVVAFVRRLDEVARGNLYNPSVQARVVLGVDMDSDGRIDDVELVE